MQSDQTQRREESPPPPPSPNIEMQDIEAGDSRRVGVFLDQAPSRGVDEERGQLPATTHVVDGDQMAGLFAPISQEFLLYPLQDDSASIISSRQPDAQSLLSPSRHQQHEDPRPESPPMPPKLQQPRKLAPWETMATIWKWWYAEILGCILGVACLVAQVVILRMYDGKPQESWAINVITINGLIALLSTFCRSALMVTIAATLAQSNWNHLAGARNGKSACLENIEYFDTTSRGVMGSLKVLRKFKGAHIACAGGVLTIATLGLGLFSQQLITTRIDNISIAAPGLVPRTSVFTAFDTPPDANLEDLSMFSAMELSCGLNLERLLNSTTAIDILLGLRSAELAYHTAILSPQVKDLDINCPSTSCHWPIVPTLGVCGACRNTTKDIKVLAPVPDRCGVSFAVSDFISPSYRPCPDRGKITADYFKVYVLGGDFDFSQQPPALGPPSQRARAGEIWAIESQVTDDGPYLKLRDVQSYRCGLWYCVQAHNISVSAGNVTDTIVETWSEIQDNIFDDPPSTFNTDPEETFTIGTTFKLPIILSNASIVYNGSSTEWVWEELNMLWGAIIYESLGNLDGLVHKLSKSLTNDVRTSPLPFNGSVLAGQHNPRYRGTMASTQATFVIRWQWLGFSIAMVLLSIVYLGVEITRTLGIPTVRPWKEDALLPFITSMDPELEDRAADGLHSPGGITKRIGMIPIKCSDEDDNGRLRIKVLS